MAGTPPSNLGVSEFTQQQADAALASALAAWTASGLPEADRQTLQAMDVRVMDLPGDMLGGETSVGLLLDRNAAGYGWNVDTGLVEAGRALAVAGTERRPQADLWPAGGMDLLSVLAHELGHVLGLDDLHGEEHAGELMSATLPAGVQRLPLGTGLTLSPMRSTSQALRADLADLLLTGLDRDLDSRAGFGRLEESSPRVAERASSAAGDDADLEADLRAELDDHRLPPSTKTRSSLVESDDLDNLLDLLADGKQHREPGSAAHDEIFADWDR